MPKIVKTVQSASSSIAGLITSALNIAKALASAVGTTYVTKDLTADSNTDIRYYIPMKNIGYPGWCVEIRGFVQNDYEYMSSSVRLFNDQTNSIDDTDAYVISSAGVNTSYGGNDIANCPETCVIFKDSTNDAISIDIHHGRTADASDTHSSRVLNFNIAIFFGKDTNNEVLCGIGNGHIKTIRTIDGMMVIDMSESRALGQNTNMASVLHLTKMVNYLSPTYAEMKSAYASVCRPWYSTNDADRNKFTESLYVDDKRWGRAGVRDNSSFGGLSSTGGITPYYPFEPYVRY